MAPSSFVSTDVQSASAAAVPSSTQIINVPTSQYLPAQVPAVITRYVSPALCEAGNAVIVPPVPNVPLNCIASTYANALFTKAVVAI